MVEICLSLFPSPTNCGKQKEIVKLNESGLLRKQKFKDTSVKQLFVIEILRENFPKNKIIKKLFSQLQYLQYMAHGSTHS